jgi:hypothetical protein
MKKKPRASDWARQYLAGWLYHQNGGDKLPSKASDGFREGYHDRRRHKRPVKPDQSFAATYPEKIVAKEPSKSILDVVEELHA